GEMLADELMRLQEQVQHQLARANKCRALLFDRGTDDRLSLLLAAAGGLERLFAQVPDQEPLHAAVQLDLAECQRLLGRYTEAAELAAALDHDGIAAETRSRARAEMIHVAIAQHDLSAAQRLIDRSSLASGQPSAEWEFARFEALLAFARAAGEGKRISANDAVRPQEMAKLY